jgi:hypothetical protein
MTGAGVRVLVRGGRLLLRVLTPVPSAYRGFELHPDDEADPSAFRIDLSRYGMGTARVLFSRDPVGGPMAVHFDRGQLLSAHQRVQGRSRRDVRPPGSGPSSPSLGAASEHRRLHGRRPPPARCPWAVPPAG